MLKTSTMSLSWGVLLVLLFMNRVIYSEESELKNSLLSFHGVDEPAWEPTRRIISDEAFAHMLREYQEKLPSRQKATNAVNRLIKYHPTLRPLIERVKNRDVPEEDILRVLFVGPSGYGKTYIAKALAKYWKTQCIFVSGSYFGSTRYPEVVNIFNLFTALLERPEQSFTVIIDHFMLPARFIEGNDHQNAIARALWQSLDACRQTKHICVVATDCGDSKRLFNEFKVPFAYNIFEIGPMQTEDIIEIMQEFLGNKGRVQCSQECLHRLAKSVKHLSIREIDDLIDESKALAIMETENPDALLTDQHLEQTFEELREPTFFEKLWASRRKYWNNICSTRNMVTGMFIAGTGLCAYNKYRREGFTLSVLGALLTGTAITLNYYASYS